jgi:ABC-2 type transport system permease protein
MMASLSRILAILMKEFIQMRRDRLTFAMMIGIPLVQLLLFGYAINTDPRHLPTQIELGDDGPAVRAIIAGMEMSEYFEIQGVIAPGAADETLRTNDTTFILVVPPDFERDLLRGERPDILLDVDASDPVAAAAGAGAFPQIVANATARFGMATSAANPVIHRRYNPAGETAMNIVPGLLGIILTMTMAMMTSMALTKEAERGTLETLLATPTRPLEVMAGKIAPYVLVGALQVALMLLAARYLFGVPFLGSAFAFTIAVTIFILVNLSLGFLFSTLARTQMQAMQMTFFVFLPSILLSGFMFPFAGMPGWARMMGEVIPTTHFIRAVRSIMLKGADLADVRPDLWPLILIFLVIATLALTRYRRTLD